VVAAPRAAPPTEETAFDFVGLYEKYLPIIVGIAVGRFGIPEIDAETLAHEIFVDYLSRSSEVVDQRGWLVGAMYNASRYYLRRRARVEPLPPNIGERPDPHLSRVLEMWPDQLAAREAFCCTTPRCQLALRLRYFEGYTIPEIAIELGITKRYATKLVGECLRQAYRRYTRKTGGGSV
jgi:RNA polymerase sigma-70 factor, ECF subfamily